MTKNSENVLTMIAEKINNPNTADISNVKSRDVSPSGNIVMHSQNGYGWTAEATQRTNWTLGCIALNNEDMEKVWQSVAVPTSIEIKP
jgi:murein L,D-transpeptidase YafK